MFNLIPSRLIVRRISDTPKEVFLTFDDGPVDFSEKVLDLLAAQDARAAFFVIGRRAKEHPGIIRRILAERHSIFSHSSDHNYINYFRSPFFVKNWIQRSLKELEDITGLEQRVFRPPGGIIPPPVWMAAKVLKTPLMLWNHRFYDWVHPWRDEKAYESLARAKGGDVVLLHDWQREANKGQFLQTLSAYLSGLKAKKLQVEALQASSVLREAGVPLG